MLYRAKNNNELESIAGTTVASGDTSPIGTTMLYDGEEVPTGWQEVEEVYSNPNLLINSDFRNPINQRGLKDYVSDKTVFYTIDRWRVGTNVSLSIDDNYITVINNDTVKRGFGQNLEFNLEENCIYTITVNVKSISGRCILQEQQNQLGQELVVGENIYTFNTKKYTDLGLLIDRVTINLETNSSISIEWIKLEQGSIATPFVPRDYAEELLLCQYYGRPIYINHSTMPPSNSFSNMLNVDINMRIAPTLTVLESGVLANITNSNISYSSYDDHIRFSLTGTEGKQSIRVYDRKYWADAEIY